MRKFLLIIPVLAVILAPLSLAVAQESITGTKYHVGDCVTINGWSTPVQLKSDGTWVPSTSSLNTCGKINTNTGLVGYPQTDAWMRSNLGYDNTALMQRTNTYPWGTNYPGGYQTTQEWIANCVVGGLVVNRADCQAFPRLINGTVDNSLLGTYTNPGLFATFRNGNSQVTVSSGTDKLGSVLGGLAIGWMLSSFLH
jgi:hypothetical protein